MSLGGDRVVHGKRKNAVVLAHPGRDPKTKTNAASNATPRLSFVHRKSLFHVMLLRACERAHCGVGVVSPATRQARTSKANINCEPTRPSSSSLTNSRQPRHDDTPKTRQARCLSPRISSISRSSKIRKKISNHYQEGDQHAPWPACFPPLLCTSS